MDNPWVSIRPIPAPYQAMLAICSDLDETPDRDVYFEIMKFLNTTGMTSMGRGVGLEVGNTIYFDMPPGQFSYWNTDDQGREMIRNLIHSGHIDCLHSFGELATTRTHAEQALNELEKHNCKLKVWIDHAQAPTNFGADIMQGQGDVIDSEAYHADLTTEYGIEYVWTGRVTSVIGQNVPRRLAGIMNWKHPLLSGKTATKEIVKGLLAKTGSKKYAMHAGNTLLRDRVLRSGQPVIEFIRTNPFFGGVGLSATAAGLSSVLTENMLNRLVFSGGVSILYTHLGKIQSRAKPLPSATILSLEKLARYYRDKKILVTTTRRLLDYCLMLKKVTYNLSKENGENTIHIKWKGDISELAGLSFCGNSKKISIYVNGKYLKNIKYYDYENKNCFYIDFYRLQYPLI